ncbi:hypothetical protein [Amycolatopsis sp. NPDC059657]|uniref:hypothetical protein n=1 Tax=Amycolatopsis sp. NPDC059657 TaxID=3346899 RepID=UPI00367199D8
MSDERIRKAATRGFAPANSWVVLGAGTAAVLTKAGVLLLPEKTRECCRRY